MNDLDRTVKRQLPHWGIMLGLGSLFAVGGGFAYRQWLSPSVPQSIAVTTKQIVERVSALGRLEPEGTTIHVFAPTAMEGARVETLNRMIGRKFLLLHREYAEFFSLSTRIWVDRYKVSA